MERAQALLALRTHLFIGPAHGPVIAELARILSRRRRQKAACNGFIYMPEHGLNLIFALIGNVYRYGLIAALDCRKIQRPCVDRRAEDVFYGGSVKQGLKKHAALYPRWTLVVIIVAAGKAACLVIDNSQMPVVAFLD